VPDKLKIATRILKRARPEVVEAIAWALVVALPALGLFAINQYGRAERAETEVRVVREAMQNVINADRYGVHP
jgi:hypothetical protein